MVRSFLALCVAALLLSRATAAEPANTPPAAVAAALQAAGIPMSAVGIVVHGVAERTPRLAVNARQPLNPASLMKLLTTSAALEMLGPAFTWRTEVLADAPPDHAGVLAGDLYLRGSGDPKLTYDRLWLLLRELRGRGLKEIRGALVLDRTAFAPVDHDPAAFDGKPQRPYNVGPDALLFNFTAMSLTLIPENGGVRVLAEPLPTELTIVNRLRVIEGKLCPAEWREALTASFLPGQLILVGDYPRPCGEKHWHLAGLPNGEFLAGVFTRLWRELGGEFSGRWREGATPAQAVLLATSTSPPLSELVRDINKFSNNVMARQLYLTLGTKFGAGDTASAGQVVKRWLTQKGLDFPELVVDNGAGLSRDARISAEHLAQLLTAVWESPIMPELVASLPIVAVDGTTKKRYDGVAYRGRGHLKTGSLEGVRGIAGYLLDRGGRRWIVVFLVNHPNAGAAQPAFDALLDRVWRSGLPAG
ncbi:D-alanyl-D-alanine carboxypeptidase/D-alanyl-D-alanine endopeptidase [Sulfuricystis multivorans]|uniref:D-alanyl-D-alanine carboxypeptidase/D-alanyl-D-alanine endopeptidase n=1 Tax=Sulfuricystis multivorans TaxID=2211108 RepID=UPI000F83E1CD|nr:D-alanyl-D-alanine carboxypeptidase/D-alanyl-D-alanine-endopeptidase [Sulfuricystis multivorans]